MKIAVVFAALIVANIQTHAAALECPAGFTSLHGRCYKFDRTWLQHGAATAQCQVQSGHLFRPDGDGELSAVVDFIKTKYPDVVEWRIGGYKDKGKWLWSPGKPIPDDNWQNNLPPAFPTLLMVKSDQGYKYKGTRIGSPWKKEKIKEFSFPYICETEKKCEKLALRNGNTALSSIYHAHPKNKCKYFHESRCPGGSKWSQTHKTCVDLAGDETCPTEHCPTGFVNLGHKCYKFDLRPIQGRPAISRCTEEKSHLLRLEDKTEDDLISGYLSQHHPDISIWRIGGFMKSGKWCWDNSTQILCHSSWETTLVPTTHPTLIMVKTDSGYKWRGQFWGSPYKDEMKYPFICETGDLAKGR